MFLQDTEKLEPEHINHNDKDKKHQHEDSKVQYDSNEDYGKTFSEELPEKSFLKEEENFDSNNEIVTDILDFKSNFHEDYDESHPDFGRKTITKDFFDTPKAKHISHKDKNRPHLGRVGKSNHSKYDDEVELYFLQHNEADKYEEAHSKYYFFLVIKQKS